jgi:hypothetical protein
MSPLNFEDIKSSILAKIQEGAWQAFGAGEIGTELFFWDCDSPTDFTMPDKIIVGELSGDNGACAAYNPSGEAWVESIEEKQDSFFMRIYFMKRDYPISLDFIPQAVWDIPISSRQF